MQQKSFACHFLFPLYVCSVLYIIHATSITITSSQHRRNWPDYDMWSCSYRQTAFDHKTSSRLRSARRKSSTSSWDRRLQRRLADRRAGSLADCWQSSSMTSSHYRILYASTNTVWLLLILVLSVLCSIDPPLWFCLSVHTIKLKRLKLKSLNSAQGLSIKIPHPPPNIRSKGQRSRSLGKKSRDETAVQRRHVALWQRSTRRRRTAGTGVSYALYRVPSL